MSRIFGSGKCYFFGLVLRCTAQWRDARSEGLRRLPDLWTWGPGGHMQRSWVGFGTSFCIWCAHLCSIILQFFSPSALSSSCFHLFSFPIFLAHHTFFSFRHLWNCLWFWTILQNHFGKRSLSWHFPFLIYGSGLVSCWAEATRPANSDQFKHHDLHGRCSKM